MKITAHTIAILMSLSLASGVAHANDDAASIVKAADQYRLVAEDMQIDTKITTLNRDGSFDKERLYQVFQQSNRQSLVVMQSPAEKGQKVLMSGEDFWMILPGSQRPIRITPMQKLLGDASIGDIATLSWSQDYEAKIIGEEQCEEKACIHLSLNAKRKSSAYQRIELWVAKSKYEPLKAELYVQSEKLAKQARFVLGRDQTSKSYITVSKMILTDNLSSKKETHVEYLGRKKKTIPEQWLNPMFLAKSPNLE